MVTRVWPTRSCIILYLKVIFLTHRVVNVVNAVNVANSSGKTYQSQCPSLSNTRSVCNIRRQQAPSRILVAIKYWNLTDSYERADISSTFGMSPRCTVLNGCRSAKTRITAGWRSKTSSKALAAYGSSEVDTAVWLQQLPQSWLKKILPVAHSEPLITAVVETLVAYTYIFPDCVKLQWCCNGRNFIDETNLVYENEKAEALVERLWRKRKDEDIRKKSSMEKFL